MSLPAALNSAPFSIALEAVHLLSRLLRFRDGADHMLANMRKETEDLANRIAVTVAEDIERQEGRPIAMLDERAAARYVDELSRFVDRRTQKEWRTDQAAGEAALARLRTEVR
jgi:putative intracellular protease/amidase